MIDIDDAQYMAAYAIVCKQVKETRRMGDYGELEGITWDDAAHCMMTAPQLLFYSQLQNWIDTDKMPHASGETSVMLLQGARAMKAIIDLGYVEGQGWWPMVNLKWTTPGLVKNTLLIMALGFHLEAMRKETLYLVAASFWIVFDIILGKGWQKRGKKLMQKAATK